MSSYAIIKACHYSPLNRNKTGGDIFSTANGNEAGGRGHFFRSIVSKQWSSMFSRSIVTQQRGAMFSPSIVTQQGRGGNVFPYNRIKAKGRGEFSRSILTKQEVSRQLSRSIATKQDGAVYNCVHQ